MPGNFFTFFSWHGQREDNHDSWFDRLHSLLTTHSDSWVSANQAFNLLSAAAAAYILATRPNTFLTPALPEFITHMAQGVFVSSDDPHIQERLLLLNTVNILYSTCYHLAQQHSELSLALAMTELLAGHFMGNIWMNTVQADQSDRRPAERDTMPAIARLT